MPTQTAPLDQATADALAAEFHRCFSDFEARDDLFVVARRLHVCEVRDGQICAVTTYCNGGWDDELRARHAIEAPMIRA